MASLIDSLIGECSSWEEFDNLAKRYSDRKFKGDLFERLTQVYLLTSSIYASKLKNVWWCNNDELPNSIRRKLGLPIGDEGIDLICETIDGEFWSVQSKYKGDGKPPTRKELGTFVSLSFNTSKKISLGLVVHTSTRPIRKATLLKNVTEIGLDKWFAIPSDEWKRIQAYCQTNQLLPPIKREPREHQEAAINDAELHFLRRSNSRGKLIMPCATGKSLTAFWIAQKLNSKTIIVSVPSLALVRQSLADWTAEYLAIDLKPEWIAVCSDETVGSTKDADSTVASVYEAGIPTTTDVDEIVRFLKRRSGHPKIIFTTYQSSGRLCEAAAIANRKFDLLICDEAHKTAGNANKPFSALLFDQNIKVKKRIFMTATERVCHQKRSGNDIIVSMDDPDIYGGVFHQLKFRQAIEQDIICDYKILTVTVSKSEAASLINQNAALRVSTANDKFETDAHNLCVGLTLRKAFKKHHIKHAVTFHSSIKRASFFATQQKALFDDTIINSHHISSKQTTGERASLLKSFESDKKAIISNARCLTEGVDIPSIDCVVFADPKESVVDIVQAAGRAMRLSKETGKEYGYILLPIIIPEEEDLADFAETTAFKGVVRVITSLSNHDERIAEQLRMRADGKPSMPSDIIQIEAEGFSLANIESDEFDKEINTRIWASVGRANWRSFEEARLWTHSQKLSGQKAWYDLMNSEMRPADIPYSPQLTYRRDWVNWGHWLGTGTISTSQRQFRSFEDAKTFVQSLNLETFEEWRRYCANEFTEKPKRPDDIPVNPQRTYQKEWTGWGEFLGTNRLATHLRVYRPFDEARAFVHKLGLKSEQGGRRNDPKDLSWRNYCKGLLEDKLGLKPDDIPKQPFKVYNEWTNWPDWLGSGGKPKEIDFLIYEEARAFALKLELNLKDIVRTANQRKNTARHKWDDYCLGLYPDLPPKPVNIPSAIHHTYKGKGYEGYRHFITPDGA